MRFEGTYTALVTPFDRKNKLDEDGLKELLRFQLREGIEGLVPVGTTGECATLSYEEHERVIEIVVKEVKGRVPVVAGTGSNSTREALMLTRFAKKVKADGALLVVPYYNRPTQEGLYLHFKTLAEEVDIPQILYNIPSRTGVNLLPTTVARLSELKNIVGIKEASTVEQVSEVIELTRGKDFVVFSGNDNQTLPILALGGVGVISVASNVAPRLVKEMVDAFRKGNLKEAQEIHYRLSPLFRALFLETNPAPVKAALELMGLPAGPPRLPLVEVKRETREELKKILSALGLR
ncbi:MAG: 4-hydroxy-tetrahydrodipicolinate synthase [Candidatus Hadarchaeales archaeon]